MNANDIPSDLETIEVQKLNQPRLPEGLIGGAGVITPYGMQIAWPWYDHLPGPCQVLLWMAVVILGLRWSRVVATEFVATIRHFRMEYRRLREEVIAAKHE